MYMIPCTICLSQSGLFHQHNALQVHPCCCKWQDSLLSYGWIMCVCVCVCVCVRAHARTLSLFSRVRLCAPLWTVARQAPLSMGILQARILEWAAMPSSRVSSQPRDRTQVSHISGRFFASWAAREVHKLTRGTEKVRLNFKLLLKGWPLKS